MISGGEEDLLTSRNITSQIINIIDMSYSNINTAELRQALKIEYVATCKCTM